VRKVIYSMGLSLDGYIAGPDGDFAWSAPDEKLHRFHNEQTRELGVHLCGRGLYETMVYWDTAEEQNPSAPEVELEFARIWRALPKVVFSSRLDRVGHNTRLAAGGPAEEVARLKAEPGADIAVGGAGLAASLVAEDLIDEFRLFVSPVIVGGGTPFFPGFEKRLELTLLETRTFGSRVVYLRYERVSAA
jgi:dihydrofolate reductase